MGLYRSPLNLETLENIFRRRGWRYEIEDNHLLTAFEQVLMVFGVDEEREIILLQVPVVPGKGMHGYVPARPNAECNAAIFLAAVNFQLALGAYTRDHHDGEIRFEVSLLVAGSFLTEEMVERAIYFTIATMMSDAPLINALLTGSMSLNQALAHLDGGQGMPPALAV
jgi:hypothetical protein